MARALSREEEEMLSTLGPHTERHARLLLDAVPDLRLTSARRSAARNREVGGSPRSFHLLGRACDFVGTYADLQAGRSIARDSRVGSRCTGPEEALIHDKGSGLHLHVAW